MTYTYIDLIVEVLTEANRPMQAKEIWDYACTKGYDKKLKSIGKTPVKTLYGCIYKDISKETAGRFVQTSVKPSLFFLR